MAKCKLLCVEKREEWEFLNRRINYVVFFAKHPGAASVIPMTFGVDGYQDFTPGQYYEFEAGPWSETQPDETNEPRDLGPIAMPVVMPMPGAGTKKSGY